VSKKRLILSGVILAGLVAGGVLLWRFWLRDILTDRATLESIIVSLGAWGPVVLVLLEALQVLLAPVPGQVVGLVAGYLYGVWWGAALCMLGLMIGTALAVSIAKVAGRPLVERLAGPDLLARVDSILERYGATALFAIFLVPFLPDDICCFIAGLSPLGTIPIMLLALVGRFPGVLTSTYIGANAAQFTWQQMLLLGVIGLVLALLFARYRVKLEALMFRMVDWFGRKTSRR